VPHASRKVPRDAELRDELGLRVNPFIIQSAQEHTLIANLFRGRRLCHKLLGKFPEAQLCHEFSVELEHVHTLHAQRYGIFTDGL